MSIADVLVDDRTEEEKQRQKIPARYEPEDNWRSPIKLFRGIQDSLLSIMPIEGFREPMVLKETPIANILFLFDPDGLRHVLMDHVEDYPKSPLQQRFLKPALGEGMLTSEGESWRMQRHAANPSFRAEQLTELVPAMIAGIEDRFAVWRADNGNVTYEARSEMMELIIEILCQALFSGIKVDRKALGQAVSAYVDRIGQVDIFDFLNLPTWIPAPKFRQIKWSIDYLKGETDRISKARRAQSPMPSDLLTSLIHARDEQTGKGYTEEQLKDTIATLLSAGFETTANAMTMTMYLLCEYPWAAEKIREEAREVLGDRTPVAGDIKNLKFTRMVLEESMRLYPPSSIVIRVAAKDDVICGQKIKKGTTIAVSQYVLHRHEKLWDNPDVFDPYRFSPENKKDRHRFAYMPFSIGPRGCIGSSFAMMETTLAIAMMMREFEVYRVDDDPVEFQLRISLRIKNPLPIVIKPRAAAQKAAE